MTLMTFSHPHPIPSYLPYPEKEKGSNYDLGKILNKEKKKINSKNLKIIRIIIVSIYFSFFIFYFRKKKFFQKFFQKKKKKIFTRGEGFEKLYPRSGFPLPPPQKKELLLASTSRKKNRPNRCRKFLKQKLFYFLLPSFLSFFYPFPLSPRRKEEEKKSKIYKKRIYRFINNAD